MSVLRSTRPITVVRTVADLRVAVDAARAEGRSVGFVPTMGALHRGHATLVREAAAEHGSVVISIFVNPTQFNDQSDLVNYPRTEDLDLMVAAEAGATIAFLPTVDEVYPAGFATRVSGGPIADQLEGSARPGHFDGMATVVVRLLNLVRADVAYFGRKDAQQLAIVEQVVRDLAIGTRIQGVDTVRDDDGLALSSRNVRLDGAGRTRALALSRGLRAARQLVADGETSTAVLEAVVRAELDGQELATDYAALVDAATFLPVSTLDRECILAVAAFVGQVRLIDNLRLSPTYR